jgi:hypothetical protein
MTSDELLEANVDAAFVVSPEAELLGALVPLNTDGRRRVRIALHLCLERAQTLGDLMRDLDELAIHLAGHDDPETGRILLNLSDAIRRDADNA